MKTPPQPPKTPIIGHLKGFKKDPAGLMMNAARDYGDVVKFQILGKKVYLLNHPDHIQYILQTHYKKFVKSPGYRPLRLLGGMGIFTSDGEQWIRQRKLYQPALSHDSIKSYADNVIQLTNEMTASWKERLEKRQNINISLEMSKITLDILSESLFSKRFEQDSSIWEAVTYSMKWIGERILKQPFVMPAKWPTAKNKKFHRSVKEMDDLIYQLIEERKQDPNPPNDLLSNFMQPKGDIQPFDAKELRDEMITIFIAGHETSANVLSWAFYLIGKHPDVKQKIKEEVDALGNRELQFQDLHELKYTTQVIKETMRLYPPVWHLGRMNVEEVEIGGYTFPKNSHLRMSPYVIHHDPKYWKNPDAFDPNRFSEDNEKEHTPYTFIPFGAGPRLCAGRNFAMMEMVLIVAKLVKEVPWELVSKNVDMDPVMTLRPRGKIEISA